MEGNLFYRRHGIGKHRNAITRLAWKMFQSLYQKREELAHFKEFISGPLPQNLSVIDLNSSKALFWNDAWLNTFKYSKVKADCASPTEDISSNIVENIKAVKPQLDTIHTERTSVSDVILRMDTNIPMEPIEESAGLYGVMRSLITGQGLDMNTLSLTGAYKTGTQHLSFQVILKQVIWEGANAVAVILNNITHEEKLLALKIASGYI